MSSEPAESAFPSDHWAVLLDERTRKHVDFARVYARTFAHGAPGHLDLMTIAALAQLLDNWQYRGGFANIPPAAAGESSKMEPKP